MTLIEIGGQLFGMVVLLLIIYDQRKTIDQQAKVLATQSDAIAQMEAARLALKEVVDYAVGRPTKREMRN